MSHSQIAHLVSMINQIASNNNYNKSDEETAHVVANHIQKFWARSMKEKISQYAQEDGKGLLASAKLAITLL